MVLIVAGTLVQESTAQRPSVSFQVFYDELSPYGSWIETPEYGYAWIPNEPSGFAPYSTNGYWVYTEDGWTWVSNYSWGWAPFHYGRWYNHPHHGYIWIPDTEWSPGWVTWRHSDDYYGWAPMGPGVSISITLGSGYSVPDNYWRFVHRRDFGRRNITNYYVQQSYNREIIHNTIIINNTRVDNRRHVTYNIGPDRNDVEKNRGRKIRTVVVEEGNKPVENIRNHRLQIYRPDVQKNDVNGQKLIPSNVSNGSNLQRTPPKAATTPSTPILHGARHQVVLPSSVQPKQQPRQQPRQQPTPQQQPRQQPRQQPTPQQQPRQQPTPQQQPRQQPRQQPTPQQQPRQQ